MTRDELDLSISRDAGHFRWAHGTVISLIHHLYIYNIDALIYQRPGHLIFKLKDHSECTQERIREEIPAGVEVTFLINSQYKFSGVSFFYCSYLRWFLWRTWIRAKRWLLARTNSTGGRQKAKRKRAISYCDGVTQHTQDNFCCE